MSKGTKLWRRTAVVVAVVFVDINGFLNFEESSVIQSNLERDLRTESPTELTG